MLFRSRGIDEFVYPSLNNPPPAPEFVYPSLNNPPPVPVITPIAPPVIPVASPLINNFSRSSSGTPELHNRGSQVSLPEQTYIALQIPTRTQAESRAFLNHCNFLLKREPRLEFKHDLRTLLRLCPTPGIFQGLVWKYKVVITPDDVREEYRIVIQDRHDPNHVLLRPAYSVRHSWDNNGYKLVYI